MMKRVLFLIVMTILLGSCTPISPDTDWSVTAVSDTDTPILIYERSGGIAGIIQRWTFYADGRIEMPDGSEKQVDPEQLQVILDAAQAANFFALSDSYVPEDSCCDLFLYDITFQLNGQNKTIQITDAEAEQPERVTAVLDAINVLIQSVD